MLRMLALSACAGLWSCATAALDTPPGTTFELRGHWIQGHLIFGRAAPGTAVVFNGQAVRVSPRGQFILGLDRDEPPKVELRITPPGGVEQRHEYGVRARAYDIQRLDGLPDAQVNPPPEAQARIAQDYEQVRAARMRDTERDDFARGFAWPLTGRISGVYGSQRILNGLPKQPHYGVDVAAPVGARVRAPASGVVSLAVSDMYFTGGTLMIDHGHGLSSTLMHLNRLLVKQGDEVKQGQVVAESGATGRVTGPHLDWRMSWFGSRVDPQLLVGPMPQDK
jgi:murein DD-endopeptidase MepM/ murein hydrolase activator NlpD